MNELELKHIAPYLPYGLKVQSKIDRTIDGIARIVDITGDNNDVKIGYRWSDSEHIWMFKPILRPLSDLYKEVDGKVGIVELAKIQFNAGELNLYKHNDVNCTVWCDEKAESFFFRYSDKCKSFIVERICGYGNIERTEQESCTNQLQLFEYLFANHYDVFGLIEKGLAVDINTI